MHPLVVASTSLPEWGALFVTACGAFGAMAVSIINAVKTKNLHNEVRPPSNGATTGALLEGIAQVQSMLVGLQHPDANVPGAMTIAREIQTRAGANPDSPIGPPPERRLVESPPAP